jgi:hypothetical protein
MPRGWGDIIGSSGGGGFTLRRRLGGFIVEFRRIGGGVALFTCISHATQAI